MDTPMPTVTVKIAGQALDGSTTALLPLAIACERGMDGVGRSSVEVIVPDGAKLPAPGSTLEISMGWDDESLPVFSGEVDRVRLNAVGASISAGDALARLANTFGAGAYEAQSPGKIARDLLSQASVNAGTIDDGPDLGSHVLFPGISLLAHLRRLAALCGASVFADGLGAVHFIAEETVSATRSFRFGVDVLDLDLVHAPATRSGVDVWGEGAAGTQGEAKSHWLPVALSGVTGSAEVGAEPVFASPPAARRVVVHSGNLRIGNAAVQAAQGRAAALARSLCGMLDLRGAPQVAPADLIELTELPAGHPVEALLAAGPLRVRRVRHRLDTTRGFSTRLEF